MRQTNRHITISNRSSRMSWLLLSLLLLCLSACSSSDDDNSQPTNPSKAPTQLYIYVYAPQQAEPTRATYEGDVSAVNQEATIYSMQIWVFTHDTKKLIGYYSPTTLPGLSSDHPYKEFQLTIDETYAETEVNSRENVDVYVLANVTPETCNVTLNETTTQAQLEASLMAAMQHRGGNIIKIIFLTGLTVREWRRTGKGNIASYDIETTLCLLA